MQIALQIVLIITFTTTAFSCNSLFMNEDQSKLISDLVTGTAMQKEAIIDKPLKLSCVLYIDEESWTIWINNNQYSSIGQNDDFSIDAVTEDCVTITLFDGRTINLTVSDERKDIIETPKNEKKS